MALYIPYIYIHISTAPFHWALAYWKTKQYTAGEYSRRGYRSAHERWKGFALIHCGSSNYVW